MQSCFFKIFQFILFLNFLFCDSSYNLLSSQIRTSIQLNFVRKEKTYDSKMRPMLVLNVNKKTKHQRPSFSSSSSFQCHSATHPAEMFPWCHLHRHCSWTSFFSSSNHRFQLWYRVANRQRHLLCQHHWCRPAYASCSSSFFSCLPPLAVQQPEGLIWVSFIYME